MKRTTIDKMNMTRSLTPVVAILVALALAPIHIEGQRSLTLDRLTVPSDRLPAGCALSPSNSVSDGTGRTRGGLWAGLPITSNPWTGDDRPIVAGIRERVVASPRLPDGPPVSRSELRRFRLQLAEDVVQAYAAIYTDAGPDLITVHAATFNEATGPDALRAMASSGGRLFIPDRTLVVLGGVGACFEAVSAYVREATNR